VTISKQSALAVIVDRAFHDVLDDHSQGDVTISDLLCGRRLGDVRSLGTPRMVIRLINIQELRQSPRLHHSIEVRTEFLGSTLVRNIKVIPWIVPIQTGFTSWVGATENCKDRQVHKIGLPETLRLRVNITKVYQRTDSDRITYIANLNANACRAYDSSVGQNAMIIVAVELVGSGK